MANEISFSGALSGFKSTAMAERVGRSVVDFLATMSGTAFASSTVTVATSATAIPLGSIVTPGWFWAKNLDATNFVRLMNGSGGAAVAKLLPGEPCVFRWDSLAAPYALADTAACLLDYLLFSA